MKIKKIILSVLLFLFALTENLFAKALPPGSGIGDVPANVLIMLDKSGSMGWRMSGGTASMRYPYDAAADSNGDILVSQYYRDGVKKFVYGSGTLDTGFGNNGVAGKSGTCRTSYSYSGEVYNDVFYTTAYYEKSIVAIRASDGACLRKYYLGFYPYNMTIDQSTGYLYVGGSNGFRTINLSNNMIYNCGVNNTLKYSYGSTVSGSYLYTYNSNKIYRTTISTGTNRCPQTNPSANFSHTGGSYVGIEANPNSQYELWTLSWTNSNMKKLTVNGAGNGATTNWTKGRRSRSNSDASNTYFYYPWGMGWDSTNNRVIAADLNKGSVQIFDTNGTWVKNFGGQPQTRMQAAHSAIKAIVTDASLTSGVNFGFADWSYLSSGFRSWSGNITTGTASPCSRYNCLKVRVHKGGAARINQIINGVQPGGGTDAMAFMRIADQYYNHGSLSPFDPNSPCQNSYILVIGDGDWYNHNSALRVTKKLYQSKKKIKTFTVAFGTGISSGGLRRFDAMVKEGGTTKAIVAQTAESLKSQLKAAISQIIASKLSFTAPAITATIESGGSLYQAQFDYRQNKEWAGTITRTKINPDGSLDEKDSGNWSAKDVLPSPAKRKIWSVVPGTDYKTDYNNFTESNSTAIANLMNIYGNDVLDYHRVSNNSDGSTNNKACGTKAKGLSFSIADGVTDDTKGLINFIRGTDYFDYDADCNLGETRTMPLGDIYHSQLVVVGKPRADTAYVGSNQESYWRNLNNYTAWANSHTNRQEVIYAGANSGILHAFDAKTGKEIWGFVPPLIAPKLPLVMNTNLNRISESQRSGGTNAIFGVDGSMVVHDMYFKSPLNSSKQWHTILFVPYGRGGAGFTVMDVTNPLKPLHLYSIYNDTIMNRVYRMDHNQNVSNYDYISRSYSIASLGEAIQVSDNYNDDYNGSGLDSSKVKCDSTQNQYCYKSKTWTFPVQGVSKKDLKIIKDGKNYTAFTVSTNSSNDTVITFAKEIQYSAHGDLDTSEVGITIKPGSKETGVKTHPEYDYSMLGETWSDPRIFRIPNKGAGDSNIKDDIYVAAMGGGYGTQFEGVGSNLTIIDLEDSTNPGRLYEEVSKYNKTLKNTANVLEIDDLEPGNIVNSTPASAVLITPDTARGINFSGALLYISDLEGKITKFNLTNMSDDGAGNSINMFDSTTLFTTGSTTANGRYMYHAMDATIGQSTNSLWLFAGTGDYERINDTASGVSNYLIGIRDPHYPLYKEVAIPTKADDITKCQNTTNDISGAKCPTIGDRGWYIVLDKFAKVTAEPTAYRGMAYFPIYEPTTSVNKCSLGNAYLCGVDDECGTNFSSQMGKNTGSNKNKKCFYVGQGVLSKIVVFADKLFANIAGQSTGKKKDLVTVQAGQGSISSYRSSWRHNY